MRAEPLGGLTFQPVCAPPVARRLRAPADLARVPVIRDLTTMLSWDAWWQAAGIAPPRTQGPTFGDPALAFDAAISEQGVLMAVDLMSADAVSDGRLVRPFHLPVATGVQYFLAVQETKRETRKVRLFRDWLRREVPDSMQGYVEQVRRRNEADQ